MLNPQTGVRDGYHHLDSIIIIIVGIPCQLLPLYHLGDILFTPPTFLLSIAGGGAGAAELSRLWETGNN
jgi:hypothetical protein